MLVHTFHWYKEPPGGKGGLFLHYCIDLPMTNMAIGTDMNTKSRTENPTAIQSR